MAGQHSAATLPYAVVWFGAVKPIIDRRGTMSVHANQKTATIKARQHRDNLCRMWGAYPPLFIFQVIDRRSGAIVATFR